MSSTLAPVTMSRRPRSASSAITGRLLTPTAPRLPGSAPSASLISSGWAGRMVAAPVASASFCSLSAWSPRISTRVSLPSST